LNKKKQNKMALLQLAESPYNMLAENNMYLAEAGPVGENYLFIPSGLFGMDQDTYVRADFFDSLSDTEFNAVMETLAPYQAQGLSAFGIVTAASALSKVAAPAIKKAISGRAEKVAAGTVKPIFKPGGPLSGLVDKVKAGVTKLKDVPADKAKDVIEKTTPVTGSLEIGGTTVDFSSGQPAAVPLFTKYKTPLLIGGAAVAGLLLYKVFKK
jgi:hypothetical protein